MDGVGQAVEIGFALDFENHLIVGELALGKRT
jgi:hypothetical protein